MGLQQSLASYRGYLFAAWNAAPGTAGTTDGSGRNRLYYGQFNTATREWARIKPAAATLPGSGLGPSIASDGTTLFAGWTEETDQLAYSMMFYPGVGWTSPTEIPEAMSASAPALAILDRTLHAVWSDSNAAAQGSQHRLRHATAEIRRGFAVGSTSFPDDSTSEIPDAFSSLSPALAVSDDGQTLFAAWIAAASDRRIRYASYRSSEGWRDATPLSVASLESPALAYFHGKLWVAWHDAHDKSMRVQKLPCLLAGATGVALLPGIAFASAAPALAECNGTLYAMGRRAADGRPLLSCLEGETWTALGAVPDYC